MLSVWIGWAAAALALSLHLRTRRRLVLVARATHEVRGPLTAARLGLHALAGEPGRVTAIDLELQRAGRALEDLAAARAGLVGPSRPELVDAAALVAAYAPAWSALAGAHGAALTVEPPLIVTQAPEPAAPGGAVARVSPRAGERPARRTLAVRACPLSLVRGGRASLALSPPPDASLSPTMVVGDPLRLAQACANLVANAAEHGGGQVRIRVRAGGEHVRIEVSDDGPGLPQPVAALTASARGRSGRRGHGLAVAAAIAEHHGGRLSAAPARTGARILLELPAVAGAARPGRAPVVA